MLCTVDWEVVTGMSSVVIALCALVFSLCQGKQAREHNKLSVRPHLSTWEHKEAEGGFYRLELINNGIGPAVIDTFSIKVDGKLQSGDGSEPIDKAMEIVLQDRQYLPLERSYLGKGYVMAPKERCTVFAVQFLGQLPSKEFVEHAIKRCHLEVHYMSFYGEKFCFPTKNMTLRSFHSPNIASLPGCAPSFLPIAPCKRRRWGEGSGRQQGHENNRPEL